MLVQVEGEPPPLPTDSGAPVDVDGVEVSTVILGGNESSAGSSAELGAALAGRSEPFHLLAHGGAVPAAVRYAATRPDLLVGLQLIDGTAVTDTDDASGHLAGVEVPTLVIFTGAGRFGPDRSQELAGGIESAVSVLLEPDGPGSAGWVSSFTEIAEGLRAAGGG